MSERQFKRTKSSTKAVRIVVVKRMCVGRSPFGDKVRNLRTALGLTQDDVAKGLGWQRTTLTNLETGRQLIPLDKFVALCRILKTTPNDLLEFK